MIEPNITEISAIAIIAVFAVREFFAYLKTKKNNNNNGLNGRILAELQAMNQNHLSDLKSCIETGNRKLRDTLHDDFIKVIELLAEIKGRLNR